MKYIVCFSGLSLEDNINYRFDVIRDGDFISIDINSHPMVDKILFIYIEKLLNNFFDLEYSAEKRLFKDRELTKTVIKEPKFDIPIVHSLFRSFVFCKDFFKYTINKISLVPIMWKRGEYVIDVIENPLYVGTDDLGNQLKIHFVGKRDYNDDMVEMQRLYNDGKLHKVEVKMGEECLGDFYYIPYGLHN